MRTDGQKDRAILIGASQGSEGTQKLLTYNKSVHYTNTGTDLIAMYNLILKPFPFW
jgi:hypothetical protein